MKAWGLHREKISGGATEGFAVSGNGCHTLIIAGTGITEDWKR